MASASSRVLMVGWEAEMTQYGSADLLRNAAVQDVVVASSPDPLNPTTAKALVTALAAPSSVSGTTIIGNVGGITTRPSATFNRPNDTTAYAVGDLVANSTTAGSVVPMAFSVGRLPSAGGMLRRVRLRKSGTGIVNAQFRIHLYSASPTPSNGDNGAWLTDQSAAYVGAFDITVDKVFTDGAAGNGIPLVGNEINFTSQTYYGLIEARAAYVPSAQETFEVLFEDLQN